MLVLSLDELFWLKNACRVILSTQMADHFICQIESTGGVDEKLETSIVDRFSVQLPTNLTNSLRVLEFGGAVSDERILEHLHNLKLVDGESLELLPIVQSVNVRRWLGL